MLPIFSLLITLSFTFVITRVAATALMLTGLSSESAKFQARSAFSGCGFTTSESEALVNHPVRRRIVMMLMLLGNIGIATVVGASFFSLMDIQQSENWLQNIGMLVAGLLLLIIIARSQWVERRLNGVILGMLKRFTSLDVRDYVAVLHLQQDYAVTEMMVDEESWLAGKRLVELKLPQEGVLVLGIERENIFIGAPTADTEILANDVLILYGTIDRLRELDQRAPGKKGEVAHREACEEHAEVLQEQEELIEEVAAQAEDS